MPDDPMPRRVRPQDRAGAASSEERGKARLSDELMSQFDAIERALRARRESEQDEELPAAQEQPATEQASVPRSSAVGAGAGVGTRVPSAIPEPPAPPVELREADRIEVRGDVEDQPARGRGRVVLIACVVAVAVLAVVATVLAVMPGSTSSSTPGSDGGAQHGAAVRPSPTPDEVQAAQWVADHVGPDHVVACDVDLCALVRQSGTSAASLVTVGTDLTEVERADVVISTSVMRTDFGAQLAAISSPEPLASFGVGSDRVDVTAVALDGSDHYGSRLVSDRDARRRIGAAVARSPRIAFSVPSDAAALRNGLVDSRLSSLLTLISSSHTLTVTSFGGTGPGAGADIPDSNAVITRVDGQPVGGFTPQSAALITLINAQQPPYRPLNVVDETAGVRISFSQPEPLGLIAGTTP